MPKKAPVKLSDTKVDGFKPKPETYRVPDGDGLYLFVSPTGKKRWEFRYRFGGKQRALQLGSYPGVGVATARKLRNKAKDLLDERPPRDPAQEQKAEQLQKEIRAKHSFEAVAKQWLEKFRHDKAESHVSRIERRFERDIYPWLGTRPIAEIEAHEVLSCVERIQARGAIETAHRALYTCGQVFRFAVVKRLANSDPTRDLRGRDALKAPVEKHHAAIVDPAGVGELLRAIDGYQGTAETRAAMKLAPLVFQRPGALRHMEWTEIDFKAATWTIPGTKLKRQKNKQHDDHIVPLSRQAIAILLDIQPLTGRGKYVFASGKRPPSDNTLTAALRRMGFSKDRMTIHGWRACARTILHERLNWRPEVIEHSLAHNVPDSLGTAYNRTRFLDDRTAMMTAWADYLDQLRDGNVVAIRKTRSSADKPEKSRKITKSTAGKRITR